MRIYFYYVEKEILLYDSIYAWTAAQFITDLDKVRGMDVDIRVNTNGGNPEDMWGMIAKMKERTKKTKVKVDGKAHSAGLYACCMAGDVECLNVSTFLLHRGAYNPWIEGDPEMFTDSRRESLSRINAFLREAFENKVDVEKFEKIKGVKLDDVFSLETRIDVFINAEEALAIGLVNKIVDLTSSKKEEINAVCTQLGIAAEYKETTASNTTITTNTSKNKATMTLADLKAQHPETYAQAIAEGAASEKERVNTWLAFEAIDPKAVTAGIKGGTVLGPSAQAEFMVKAMSGKTLEEIKAANAPEVKTGEPGKEPTAEEKALAASLAICKENLGLK